MNVLQLQYLIFSLLSLFLSCTPIGQREKTPEELIIGKWGVFFESEEFFKEDKEYLVERFKDHITEFKKNGIQELSYQGKITKCNWRLEKNNKFLVLEYPDKTETYLIYKLTEDYLNIGDGKGNQRYTTYKGKKWKEFYE